MLVTYTMILYVVMPACYSVSIRRGVETAKQLLKSNNITDLDICTPARIALLCANQTGAVCSVRLVNKKMEFKQFDNACYMNLDNICVSQDNIWAIKHFGPCIINPDFRRFANTIEKAADDITEEYVSELAYDDYGRRVLPKRKEKEPTTETADIKTEETSEVNNSTFEDIHREVKNSTSEDINREDKNSISEDINREVKNSAFENINREDKDSTSETTRIYENVTEKTTDSIESETTEIDDVMPPIERMANGDYLNFGEDEIGKILDEAGNVKPILRENSFPPMVRVKAFDNRTLCKNRKTPCPLIYLPVCIHHEREDPDLVEYYYFINRCEAQQWSCYYPDKPFSDKTAASSMRTNFCAHASYLVYSRFVHAISAWTHYGWLHGSGRFNHMLRPNERARKMS